MNLDQILITSLCGGFLLAFVVLYILLRKNKMFEKVLGILLKAFAVTLFAFYIVRNTLSDQFIWIINGGTYNDIYYENHDYLQSFLRWSFLVSVCILPCAAFYKNRTLHRFAFIISLANVVLSVVYYNNYMNYFTKTFVDPNAVRGIVTAEWFRHFEFDVELISMGLATILIGLTSNKDLLFRKPKDIVNFVVYLPSLFLVAIPVCIPQSLFGFSGLIMQLFSIQHFIWLGGTIVLLLIIYFWFRNKDKTIKKIVILYACLFVFQHYNSIYLMSLSASRLPFQLCNVGSYFMLIAFIFHNKPKMQKFFDFIFIVNIFGTLVATIGFDLDEGMLSYWNIHYYLEHIWVFSIPFLMLAFDLYKIPSKHCYLHAFVGFTIYFVVCLGVGLYFNAYCFKEGDPFWNKVNYFYLFDSTVEDILTFLKPLAQHSIYVHGYLFNPFIPMIVYAMYLPGCFITFLVTRKLYNVGKDHRELHIRKHALKKAAKEIEQC